MQNYTKCPTWPTTSTTMIQDLESLILEMQNDGPLLHDKVGGRKVSCDDF